MSDEHKRLRDEGVERQVSRLGVVFPANWSRDRRFEYTRALSRFSAEQVMHAVDAAISQHDGPFAPQPSWLIERIMEPIRKERARLSRERYDRFMETGDSTHLVRKE